MVEIPRFARDSSPQNAKIARSGDPDFGSGPFDYAQGSDSPATRPRLSQTPAKRLKIEKGAEGIRAFRTSYFQNSNLEGENVTWFATFYC